MVLIFIVEKSSIDDKDNFKVSSDANIKSESEQRKQLVEKCSVGIENWLIEENENVADGNKSTTVRAASTNTDVAKNTDNPFVETNSGIEEVISNYDESPAPINNPFTKTSVT